jgi:hypothetical protein
MRLAMPELITIKIDGKDVTFTSNSLLNPFFKLAKNQHPFFAPIEVRHDPAPNQHFVIRLYDVLQKIMWHVIRHAIYERIETTGTPVLLKHQVTDHDASEKWNNLLKKIKCNIWHTHLSEKNIQRRNSNMENLNCNNCIDKNGLDTFRNCVNLFKPHVNQYLKTCRAWIETTVADRDYVHCYGNPSCCNQSDLNSLKRRHVHLLPNRGTSPEDIWAFVIEHEHVAGNWNYCHVFKLILQKISGNTGPAPCYRLRTIFGMDKVADENFAIEMIRKHIDGKLLNRPDYQHAATCYCHPSNW